MSVISRLLDLEGLEYSGTSSRVVRGSSGSSYPRQQRKRRSQGRGRFDAARVPAHIQYTPQALESSLLIPDGVQFNPHSDNDIPRSFFKLFPIRQLTEDTRNYYYLVAAGRTSETRYS